jgi:hypothetical protein
MGDNQFAKPQQKVQHTLCLLYLPQKIVTNSIRNGLQAEPNVKEEDEKALESFLGDIICQNNMTFQGN